MTKNGYYRVWIGLRLLMGEYNKMYNFTIAEGLLTRIMLSQKQKLRLRS